MLSLRKKIRFASLLAILLLTLVTSSAQAAKNVIIMISDGAGYNSWLAASMYQGKVGKQVYDQPGWVKLSATTYPLNLSSKPTGRLEQDKSVVYDFAKAWDATNNDKKSDNSLGYSYLKTTATDSAAAATAMATGHKTYNNAINWTNENEPMTGENIAEIAKEKGKAVGVITTVPWSHATPAGFGGAHNVSRNNYVAIANEMLNAPWLDVIMGAGHPEFDEDGQARNPKKKTMCTSVDGERGNCSRKDVILPVGSWSKTRKSLQSWPKVALAPTKLLGVPQTATTLQEKRYHGRVSLSNEKHKLSEPFEIPMKDNVPSLAVMSKAAIHVLEKNPHGFYLMIEGGAVDWANHANEPERLIEEQIDYVQAVETVVAWVEKNSNWDDTLLILTADHECGHLWGPESDKIPFQPLDDRGPGKLPGLKYNSNGHANSLVPIYARGEDAELFSRIIKGKDEKAAAVWNISGDYVDDTDIFTVMKAAVKRANQEK